MADMGLAGMGGAAGAGDALQTLFTQRMQAAQMAQTDALTRLKAQELADATAARLEQSRQAEQDKKDAATAQDNIRKENQARLNFQMLPLDRQVGSGTVGSMTSAGLPPEAFTPTPASEPAPPPGIAAPGAPTTPQPMPGTVANAPFPSAGAPSPNQVSFTRIQTAQEKAAQAEQQRKADELTRQDARDAEIKRHNLADENKPQKDPTSSFQLQPEIDPTTGRQTGRFLGYNTKANRWEPVQGQGPGATKAAPGAAQEAQQTKFAKDAVDSLNQTEKALDSVKDLVGPFEGRGETVEQMIGNADPKIQAFGTKLLLTKFRVDHAATGTARAGASPAIMARWDNLLNNKVSYEGMKAALQAAREILGPDAGPTSAKVIKYDMDGKPIGG